MDAFYLYGSVYIPRKGGCIPWRSRERARDTGVATVNISRTRTRPSDRRRTACHGLSGSPYRASVSDPPSPRQGLRPWSRRRRGFSKYSCPLGWSIFFVHCYQIFFFDLVTLFQEFYLEIRLEGILEEKFYFCRKKYYWEIIFFECRETLSKVNFWKSDIAKSY